MGRSSTRIACTWQHTIMMMVGLLFLVIRIIAPAAVGSMLIGTGGRSGMKVSVPGTTGSEFTNHCQWLVAPCCWPCCLIFVFVCAGLPTFSLDAHWTSQSLLSEAQEVLVQCVHF